MTYNVFGGTSKLYLSIYRIYVEWTIEAIKCIGSILKHEVNQ